MIAIIRHEVAFKRTPDAMVEPTDDDARLSFPNLEAGPE
jgi:hypothetical protein